MPDQPSVFVSYRRIDTNWATVALRNQIGQKLPGLKLFMDVESIKPGDDVSEVINRTIDQCQVMLVLIGPNWLGALDNNMRRRLDNPNDFVRLEIARALERNIRVIPILIDDADMPAIDGLPDPLQALSRKNAVKIVHHSYDRDMEVVINALKDAFPGVEETTIQSAKAWPLQSKSSEPLSGNDADYAKDIAGVLKDAGVDGRTIFEVARQRHLDHQDYLAEKLYECASDVLAETEGQESIWTLVARHNVANAILNQGKAVEAEAQLTALFPLMETVLGPEHPSTLGARHELARALLNQGKAAEAESRLMALLPLDEKLQNPEHPDTLKTRAVLAHALLNQGKAAEAEAELKALLPLMEKVHGPDHLDTLAARRFLTRTFLEQGNTVLAKDALGLVTAAQNAPLHTKARNAMLRGWLADCAGDAAGAEALLNNAEALLSNVTKEHYMVKDLARYRETRVPGAAGGTMVWAQEN